MANRGTFRRWPRAIVVLLWAVLVAGCTDAGPGPFHSASPSSASPSSVRPSGPFEPPDVTPRPDVAAAPAGDGTRAVIHTALGDITMELYNQSAPVAAANFIKLAGEHFYDGVVFHRIVPGFVIQGGDPTGTGSGGPGYTIQDEAVVGDYERGVVAMARTSAPNSQGSQFFICLTDLRDRLPKSGGYVIFGRVTSGMVVADKIAAGPNSGSPSNQALQPVAMTSVEIVAP
jgi:cyclophilin family peptidyl-prolyl cis-trans isomerase